MLYVDTSKNINILSVDGNERDFMHAIIEYKNIHYYERAGAIHYTTRLDANGDYINAKFTPAQWRMKPAVLGGLLFGPMGMGIGMMKAYKPQQYEPGTFNFNITSEIDQIDDRCVVLNYYSELRRQYLDIELPQDIFNYLQTYLPEKKYSIVFEVEKNGILGDSSYRNKEDLIEFKNMIEKLMIMKQVGMITEEEFLNKKEELLKRM